MSARPPASLAHGFLTDLNGSTALFPARRRGSPSIATGQAPLAIALAVAAVFALAGSGPALAQTFGGQGGSLDGTPTTAGGTAGVGGGFNQAGGDADPSSFSGGGGGGATLSNAGGARPGGAAPNSGGAGGSGGLNGYDASTGAFSPTTAYTGFGGAAGLAGTGPFDAGGGGGGGAGGYGAILTGTGSVITQSAITGGTGGAGGNAASSTYGIVGGFGGNGGDGGVGIDAIGAATITTTVAADIRGGYGGVGGLGGGTAYGNVGNGGAGIVFLSGGQLINAGVVQGGTAGTPDISGNGGAGGIGVVGANIAIVNAGIIAGGQSADGARVAAVAFAGGTNSLTLQAGYVFDGVVVAFSAADTLALGGATNASFDTSQIGAAGSGSQFQGFGIYQKIGTSTWTLTGTTGETTSWQVLGGALAIANDAALGGPAGTLTLAGGALRTTASFASPRGITLGAAGGTLNTDAGTTFTAAGVIGGPGSLTKIGSGTLILTQTNTYAGGTAIDAGTVVASSDANFGANTGPLSFAGGATLRLGASFDIAATRAVTLVNGGGTIDTNGFTTTIGSTLSGVGGLVKIGLGTLDLTAANSYQGGTSILAGTAGFGTGTSFGSGGIVLSNATLAPLVSGLTLANGIGLDTPGGTVATGANDLTLAGAILGSGALTKTGAGSLTVTQANLYSGGTLLQGGALAVGNSQSLGTGSLAMSDGTVLRFAADGLSLANTVALAGAETVDTAGNGATLAGVVSGAGSLTKVGAGTLALTGTNTYAGGTAINGGTVRASADANLGAASGPLSFAGGATLQFGAAFDLAPTRTVTLNAGGGTIDTNGVDTTIGSVVGGAGSLTKAGLGSLALTQANSYAGGTLLQGGALAVGNSQALGTGSLAMSDGTVLRFAADGLSLANTVALAGAETVDTAGNGATLAGVVSGAGSLTKVGAGTLALTGTNTYAGGTAINGGTVRASADANLGAASGPLSFAGGATLQFGAAFDLAPTRTVTLNAGGGTIDTNGVDTTIGSVVGGAGSLTKAGAGTLALTGTNSYAGGTAINGGVVVATADANLGAATGPLSFAGGTLRLGAAFDPAATRSITLNAGGGTIDTNGFATTLGSTVSGVGSLTKAGLGSLALTQANSYAGGTLLQMGTLVVGNSQSLGTGPLSMDDGTTLAFAADGLTIANAVVFTGVTDPTIDTGNNSETISGVISGPGALTKIGAGTLDLTGTNTYTGATTVAQGTLLVDGSVAGSVVSVASGAFVGGSGTLGGLVALAGSTVAPGAGTPYSTLTVAGNVTFDGGSTYEVRIDAAGQTDLVRATGTATISGASTVSVLAANGAYTAGQTYTILTAASRTGSFVSPPTTTSNLAFLSPTLTTDAANDVILSLAQSPVTFPSVAQTPNQSAAAGGIQGLGAGNPLYNAVQGQTTQGALRAFDATSGEAHASAASVAILDSRFVPSTIFDRLWNVGGAGLDAYQILQGFGPTTLPTLLRCYAPTSSSVPAIPSTYAVWGQAIGIFGHNDGDGNAASLDRTLGGFIVGFDAPVYGTMGDVWRFGAAAGYTKDWFGTPARDSDGTYGSVFGTLYGGARFGSVDLRFGASYAANSTTLRRTVAFPGFLETERSTYGGDTVQGFGEFGYRFAIGKSVFEPIAGFTATHVEQDGFREKGGAAALLGFGRDTDVQTTTLGFRSEASPFESLPVVARIMLGWQHAFGDLSPTSVVAFEAGSAPFTVSGAPIDRDALVAEAELNYRVTSSLTLGLSYTGQVGQRADENSVRGRIDYRF